MIKCLSHYFLLSFCFLFIGCKLSDISKANLAFLIEMGEFINLIGAKSGL